MNLKYAEPVVIEAFQMTEERRASNADWPEWMYRAWQLDREAPGSLYPTEEGTATARFRLERSMASTSFHGATGSFRA